MIRLILHLLLHLKNTNRTNQSSNVLEILHVSRFPSDLVHRQIHLLHEKMVIISPDNTL